jgi:ligand-binding sensor domain-containing protein/putative methionine-R-sulfoxide reductase with GAF domain
MKTLKVFLPFYVAVISGILFFCPSSEAQTKQFRFKHFTNEDGLIQNTVYDCVQDKYGYMWFSTKNGVCRYDGYSVKTFKPSDYFSDDRVNLSQCIETALNGNILFGTGYGFYEIDIETDSIIKFVEFLEIDSSDTYINNITCLRELKDCIWAGTGNGLVRYDKLSGKKKYFSRQDLVPDSKSPRLWLKAIEQDLKGNLILATNDGLIRFNPVTFSKDIFNSRQGGAHFINNNYFSSLTIDSSGKIWTGTLKKGIYVFDLGKNILDSIPFISIPDSSKEFNEIKKLCLDSKGCLWAGTQYSGLARINTKTKFVQRIRSSLLTKHSLASDFISALYEDRYGILWVGTYNNGVDRTSVSASPFFNIPGPGTDSSCFNIKAVSCFTQQDSTYIWVGTMSGLFRFNRNTLQCERFEEVTENKIKLPHASISALECDSENYLWIGTRSSIMTKVNLNNFEFSYVHPDTLEKQYRPGLTSTAIIKLPGGSLYFGFNYGLFTYDKASNTLKHVTDVDSLIFSFKNLDGLSFDFRNNIFLSSGVSCLHRFNTHDKTFGRIKSYDENKNMLSECTFMRQLRSGNYLLSDLQGLHELDSSFHFLNHYNSHDGMAQTEVLHSVLDLEDNAWLSTYNGLSFFDTKNKTFTNYYAYDGLLDNEIRQANLLRTAAGEIFVPHNTGFSFFNPASLTTVKKNAQVFFTSFKILNKEIQLPANINNMPEIKVPAASGIFTISFSSTAYDTYLPNDFVYFLDGFDKEWISARASNSATYTNLDGGTYFFRVKIPGIENSERSIRVVIGTVFYKTWLFRASLFLVLAYIVFRFIRFREKQIRKKEAEKTIDYFANSFYGKNTVEEILWDVCRNCISRLGFEDAVVYLLDEKRNLLIQKAAYGSKNPKDFEIAQPMMIPVGQGIVGAVALTGKAEIVPDTTKDMRYIPDDEMRLSEISVPIIYENKVIGVIDSEHSRKNFFTSEHLRLLTTIASICSTKITKALSDQETAEKERKLLEVGKKMAETRLMALRAQMNPHFIFNSLNSIQDCIVNNHHDRALSYLTQFSKLLRLVIDYSDRMYISLEKEIEFLNLYLNIESLRFSGSFSFEINVSDDLDTEEVFIPSLLVQPFAENAIWHGLLHKQGNRKLTICFSERQNAQLKISIEDNGIGRERAGEIKATKINGIGHQSKGMKISEERISLLKLQNGSPPEIVVIDLKDPSGEPAGTKVEIYISTETVAAKAE